MKSKKYAKKLLSLIIASVMIVTMLPVSALAAGVDDVMIEDQAETIVEEATGDEVVEEAAEVPDIEDSEDAAIVDGAVDEIAEADPEELTGFTDGTSLKVEGVLSGSNMQFDAQLTGLSVSAVVPAKRAARGSVMTADIVDVSAYEDAIAKKNYGKSIAGLYGLELHFYDKKDKEIKHINTSDITVTVDGLDASSYFIGRIDNKVKKIQRGTEPTFTFTEKKAYTYVIAGLEDDGLVRATAETDRKGNKRFNLNEENVSIEVVAPKGAFAEGVAMEASDVTNGAAENGEDVLVGASSDEVVAAYEISFYNEDGDEQQPSKGVAVTINTTLDMTKSYKLIHIADDGTSNEVEGAKFTENGVEFVADSFSVYAVVWKDAADNDCTATIHWGTYEGDNFEEFDSITTIDTNASSVDLAVNVDEYYYAGARYKESESDDGVRMVSSVIKKANNGGWTVDVAIVNDDDSVTETTIPVEDGSHIYLYYAEKGGGGYTPPGPPPATLDSIAPETRKQVTKNQDGTYTIRLDVEGHATEDTKQGANVIVMLDMTYSMRQADMGGGTTRIAAAKSALLTLIDALNPGYDAQHPDKNLVNFTLATFGNTNSTTTVRNWTQDRSQMESAVNGLSNNPGAMGTNWQGGLQGAEVLAEAANTNADLKKNPTYVIFVTDGAPNCWEGHTSSSTGNDLDERALPYAQTAANSLTQDAILYGVFCGPASGFANLDNVIRNAHGANTINGASTTAMKAAFSQIAGHIVAGMAASNVTVDDGIPSLSNVSANVTAGEAGGFKYYITPKNGSETKWTKGATGEDDPGAPGASYDQSNGVTWDLGEVGELKDGWLYSIEFTVWPSQKAYDTIADLNNGVITMNDEALEAAGIAKPAGEGQPYTLKTNTHLNTAFTDPSGHVYTETNDWTQQAMPLPTTTIKVRKYWNNDLDDRTAIENATIIVTKDGADYFEVGLGQFSQVPGYEHKWIQEPNKEIYISMGQLTLDTSTNKINVISDGHEYSVKEPDAYSHNWWLTADIYHPMMINGEPTVLVEVKEDDIPSSLSGLADNMRAVDGGKEYYKFQGRLYVVQEEENNVLEATNDRRSNLNFTKTVTGENAPEDAYFTYTATITESQGKDVWFSIFNAPEGGTIVKDTSLVTGATAEDGNTGYWYFPSGGTVTIKIKAGWNVRFINLPNASEYEIVEEESSMEPGWIFTEATSSVISDYDAEPAETDGSTASGTIDEANTQYVVKYKNEYLGVFYVYHSSDCSVERFPMAVDGVEVTSFNIFEKTASGTLYGGYYNDYAGKSASFDAKTLTYTGSPVPTATDAGGSAYDCAYIKTCNRAAWNSAKAYTHSGKAMTPVKDTVYYLKEVPTAYLQPYTHYTYKKGDKSLQNMWYISANDDLRYDEAGFFVETFDAKGKKTATIVTTLTVTNSNGGATVTLSPKSVFGNRTGAPGVPGVQAGYLTYWDAKNLMREDQTSVFTPFWYTPDHIYVCGIKTRTINFNKVKVGSGSDCMVIADADNTTPFPNFA